MMSDASVGNASLDSSSRFRYRQAMWWSAARTDSTWWWYQGIVWKGLVLTGLFWLGAIAWGSWRDGRVHAAARARFLEICTAERGAERCAWFVEQSDLTCARLSGLLLERPGGAEDYDRCLLMGETAYRAARGVEANARRKRRQDAWR